jgi:(2R)-3-sulfolactate dehydrogenase (NADP+)
MARPRARQVDRRENCCDAKQVSTVLSLLDIEKLSFDALRAVGADDVAAGSLARATAAAEADGQRTVGLAHLVDYLDAYRAGRIRADARPTITRPRPTMFLVDAGGGLAHPGFELAFDDFVEAAHGLGLAMFAQKNAFTCGSLGAFVHRLALRGLIGLAATNGPPMLAGSGGGKAIFCTNPLAFAAPRGEGRALLIDQASSATAFVNIRAAAEAGERIPAGWAVDADGRETTDPHAAMQGALLAFGGTRGANIALMVEVLAAGLSGANWSADAPPFGTGDTGPGTGLFVLAIDPVLLDPDFPARLDAYLRRLSEEFGVHVPGEAKEAKRLRTEKEGVVVPKELVERIRSFMG